MLESEKIVTISLTNDLIALTRKGSRGLGAQPPLFNKQNVDLVLRHKLRPVNQRCALDSSKQNGVGCVLSNVTTS